MKSLLYRVGIFACCLGLALPTFAATQKTKTPTLPKPTHTQAKPKTKAPQKKTDSYKINVHGISGAALKNVVTQLTLKKDLIPQGEPMIVRWSFYKKIPEETKAALQPFGYFKSTVTTKLQRHDRLWEIDVYINPGQRLKFTTVKIILTGQGKHNKAFRRYLRRLPLKTGEAFNSEKYENVKTTLQDIANNHGFFNGKIIDSKLTIDLKTYTSSAVINYDTGNRFRFGNTLFSPSPIKDSLLERYLVYSPGQYYLNKKLDKSREDLLNSPYFQQVVITPKINQAHDLHIPVDIKLFPQDQVNYSFGAGYGTDTGVRGLISTDLRYLNASGHTFKMLLRGSQRNSELAGTYTIPGPKPARDLFSIVGGLLELNQVTGKGKNAQIGGSYQTRLLGWQVNLSLNYLVENYHLFNYPVSGENIHTNTSLLYPRITLQRIRANDKLINPWEGYNIIFSASAANESVGSKTSFSQYRLDTKFLYTIKKTSTRIVTRASFGATDISCLSNLPLSLQFFAGGAISIRGFEFNSIGPGRILAVGSFELQQRLVGKFYLAGFIDAGNVNNNPFKVKPYIGTGPAVVYLTPIGPLEVSFAKAISPQVGGWRVQFSMGALL